MRTPFLALTCGAALIASGCGAQSNQNTTGGASNSNAPTATRPAQTANLPPVSSAHGGGSPTGGGAPVAGNAPAATKPGGLDTAALDAKVERADAKAKSAGATQADKNAAASAYLERGNLYRDAGQPALYKFALGDYRHALRYQPDNAEAREKMNEIVSIYQSLGRPVPDNGNEP
ncbi:MAG TPA: tetratricopeptide repeat protein [Pyrinomonadaceae bacterium]|nr:tetratricopeptide repeat protein [Pyrinomonadaceae bacterium]